MIAALAAAIWPAMARAAGAPGAESVQLALAAVVVMLFAAKLGGAIAQRLGQPGVLGELLAGVVLGNLVLAGFDGFEFARGHEGVLVLAEIGILLLLFEAGLESTVGEMLRVGPSSLLVAVCGVVVPLFLGWGVSAWLLPDESRLAHIFVGATLCATSVGITARVLSDLGRLSMRESKIVLGAAAIDDVLGLVILAVVAGTIEAVATGQTLMMSSIAVIVAKAFGFLLVAVVIGGWFSGRLFALAEWLGAKGLLLPFALAFCFGLSWAAGALGLAPIVGAFAAGLVLEEVHYRDLEHRDQNELEDLVRPITAVLSPIFFVLMGMGVDLGSFASLDVLLLAAALTAVAILGKMSCYFGVLEPGLNRLAVAVGMVPRGEVGLIFAGIGARLVLDGHPVIAPPLYAATVVMVTVTTLITPPTLKMVLERGDRRAPRPTPAA